MLSDGLVYLHALGKLVTRYDGVDKIPNVESHLKNLYEKIQITVSLSKIGQRMSIWYGEELSVEHPSLER